MWSVLALLGNQQYIVSLSILLLTVIITCMFNHFNPFISLLTDEHGIIKKYIKNSAFTKNI